MGEPTTPAQALGLAMLLVWGLSALLFGLMWLLEEYPGVALAGVIVGTPIVGAFLYFGVIP